MKIPSVLTIAGSDSGGGAGIQADLKTFVCHRVHGSSAITCVTAQNTQGVNAVVPISGAMVKNQLDTVTSDLTITALKTGMLLNAEITQTVVDFLQEKSFDNVVVDPVMVSRTGDKLINEETIDIVINQLLSLASVITPNIYEAQIISGMTIANLDDMKTAAEKISQRGIKNVLIKGGGLKGEYQGVDLFYNGEDFQTLQTQVINTKNNHGTGCTLSAAITANLALGKPLFTAIAQAKEYVTEALNFNLDIGGGNGPVGHVFPLISNTSNLN